MLSDESTAKFEIELVNKQVQKIKQAKKDCQTHYGKQLGCGTCKALQLCMWIDELVDTIEAMRKHIEALQQENEQLKEQINTAKIGWDTYKTYSEQLEQQTAESNKIIETQRQEIEKLKATLADWKYNTKCDADHIAALTADKDEQAGRLMQYDTVLKQASEHLMKYRRVYGSIGTEAIAESINALLGGKEDV